MWRWNKNKVLPRVSYFNQDWTSTYLMMSVSSKSVCLICRVFPCLSEVSFSTQKQCTEKVRNFARNLSKSNCQSLMLALDDCPNPFLHKMGSAHFVPHSLTLEVHQAGINQWARRSFTTYITFLNVVAPVCWYERGKNHWSFNLIPAMIMKNSVHTHSTGLKGLLLRSDCDCSTLIDWFMAST